MTESAPEATTEVATTEPPSTTPTSETVAEAGEITAADDLPTDVAAARKLRSEARNLRTRLREAEEVRDQHAEQVTGLQRQIAELALEGTGVTPAALWASGADVSELLDEDGRVDPDLVRVAAKAASDLLGLIRQPAPNHAQGAGASGAPGGSAWGDAFKAGGAR